MGAGVDAAVYAAAHQKQVPGLEAPTLWRGKEAMAQGLAETTKWFQGSGRNIVRLIHPPLTLSLSKGSGCGAGGSTGSPRTAKPDSIGSGRA